MELTGGNDRKSLMTLNDTDLNDTPLSYNTEKRQKHGKNSRKEGVLMQIVLKTHYRRKKVREKYCGFKIKL